MLGRFFWRLGVAAASLWLLLLLLIGVASPGPVNDGAWAYLALLGYGLGGSAIILICGAALGFVFGGFSSDVRHS